MQTGRLFYEDSAIRTFSALVIGCEKCADGYAVTLDRTAFFPGGGGQACDTGTLDGIPVTKVTEQDGQILHICPSPLEPWKTVQGVLNWDIRLDQMQQHSGEHIVSGIIHRVYGYHNVGFHVGADAVTIDFDGVLPLNALEQIEEAANRAIWENLPVSCTYPEETELKTISYRSKKALAWPVRIVRIGEVDCCACCGVHVKYTGQIGLIKLLSCTKFHQGVRIEMLCGRRALALLNRAFSQNRQVSQAFSAKILETGAAAEKMNEALSAEKFRASALEKRLFAITARDCAGKGNVARFEPGLTPGGVRALAEEISLTCGGTAAVFSGSDESGYSLCVAQGDAAGVFAVLRQKLGVRGGGNHGFFQGSVRATAAQISEALAEISPAFVYCGDSEG